MRSQLSAQENPTNYQNGKMPIESTPRQTSRERREKCQKSQTPILTAGTSRPWNASSRNGRATTLQPFLTQCARTEAAREGAEGNARAPEVELCRFVWSHAPPQTDGVILGRTGIISSPLNGGACVRLSGSAAGLPSSGLLQRTVTQ